MRNAGRFWRLGGMCPCTGNWGLSLSGLPGSGKGPTELRTSGNRQLKRGMTPCNSNLQFFLNSLECPRQRVFDDSTLRPCHGGGQDLAARYLLQPPRIPGGKVGGDLRSSRLIDTWGGGHRSGPRHAGAGGFPKRTESSCCIIGTLCHSGSGHPESLPGWIQPHLLRGG